MDHIEKLKSIEIDIELIKQSIKVSKDALLLQAKEYERRLEILNHEADQLKKMQETYVKKETYEIEKTYYSGKIDSLVKIVYMGLGIVITIQLVLSFIFQS